MSLLSCISHSNDSPCAHVCARDLMADASSALCCCRIPLGGSTSLHRDVSGTIDCTFVNKSPQKIIFYLFIFQCIAFFGHLCCAVRINASVQWKAGVVACNAAKQTKHSQYAAIFVVLLLVALWCLFTTDPFKFSVVGLFFLLGLRSWRCFETGFSAFSENQRIYAMFSCNSRKPHGLSEWWVSPLL